MLGNARFFAGEKSTAVADIDSQIDFARATADQGRLAHALYMSSVAHACVGNASEARNRAASAMRVADDIGNPTARAQARFAVGFAQLDDDPASALAMFKESADVARSVGNRWSTAFAETEGWVIATRLGDRSEAYRGFVDALDLWYRARDWANQWIALRHAIRLLAAEDLSREAVLVAGAIAGHGAAHALPLNPRDQEQAAEALAGLRDEMGPEQYESLIEQGRGLSVAAVVDMTRAALLATV